MSRQIAKNLSSRSHFFASKASAAQAPDHEQRSPRFTIRKNAGFTLLEVLVALVVLAVALVALTRTAAIETSQFGAARDRTLAGWVAANALTDERLQPGMPPVGRRSGKVTMAKREWHYRVTVSTTQSQGIRRIHVDVYESGERAGVDDVTPLLGLDGFAGESL